MSLDHPCGGDRLYGGLKCLAWWGALAGFGSLAFTSQSFPMILTTPVRPGIVLRMEAATPCCKCEKKSKQVAQYVELVSPVLICGKTPPHLMLEKTLTGSAKVTNPNPRDRFVLRSDKTTESTTSP